MSVTPATIIPAKTAENTQTTQYTSTGARTAIDTFTARNYAATPVTLSVNLVPSGGSASSSNLIESMNIGPSESVRFNKVCGHTLQNGDFISTVASAASSVAIMCSGRTVT